jgi:hypothetical protein
MVTKTRKQTLSLDGFQLTSRNAPMLPEVTFAGARRRC